MIFTENDFPEWEDERELSNFTHGMRNLTLYCTLMVTTLFMVQFSFFPILSFGEMFWLWFLMICGVFFWNSVFACICCVRDRCCLLQRIGQLQSKMPDIWLSLLKPHVPRNEECIICFETIHDMSGVELPCECQYQYHKKCILRWFFQKNKAICPTCRVQLTV